MPNKIVYPMIMVIILTSIVCRWNTNLHKKNYNKFLDELNDSDYKHKNEISMLMKYLSNHYEIQESNQFSYVLIIIIILSIFFYSL